MIKKKCFNIFIFVFFYFLIIYFFDTLFFCDSKNCIIDENFDNNKDFLDNIKKYYVLKKSIEQNVSKLCFIQCLAALEIQFTFFDYKEPFFFKQVLGSSGDLFFKLYYDYLLKNENTTDRMRIFLEYLITPVLQKKNYDNFKLLYSTFIVDYCNYFEKE